MTVSMCWFQFQIINLRLNWKIEGEKMKDLVIDKMEKALLPNLRENIIDRLLLNTRLF